MFNLDWRLFRRGFVTLLPLWLVAAPFAVTYVIAARTAEVTPWQAQLLSLTLYSAAAQLAMMQLLASGTAAWTILLTMVVMNLHQLLYGLSIRKQIRPTAGSYPLLAWWLTDAAYGVAIADPRHQNVSFLLGAELSIFIAWNLCTALALWFGRLLSQFDLSQVSFIAPLTFFLLLVGVVKSRIDLAVVGFSVALTLLCMVLGLGRVAVVLVAIGGGLFGMWLSGLVERG